MRRFPNLWRIVVCLALCIGFCVLWSLYLFVVLGTGGAR